MVKAKYDTNGDIICYSPYGCLYGGDCHEYGCAYDPQANPDTKYEAEEDFFKLVELGKELNGE